MLKSEKYEYGSMWTMTGFWDRVTHISDNIWVKLFILYPVAVVGASFMLLFTLCGGWLLTAGSRRRRKREAEVWRHREQLEAIKTKATH